VLASAVAVAVTIAGGAELVRINDGTHVASRTVAAVVPPSSPAPSTTPVAASSTAPASSAAPSLASSSVAPRLSPSASTVVLATPTPTPASKPRSHATGTATAVQATPSANATGVPPGPAPKLTALGDSVMVDAAATLSSMCAGTEVHAVVGWQASSVFGELSELRAAHHLGEVVIIETGTNGIVSSK
jgi:hypothetical protein